MWPLLSGNSAAEEVRRANKVLSANNFSKLSIWTHGDANGTIWGLNNLQGPRNVHTTSGKEDNTHKTTNPPKSKTEETL